MRPAVRLGVLPLRRRAAAWLGLLALAALPLWLPNPYLVSVVTEILIYGIFVASLDLLIGYAGAVSLGHAAFFGLGAYTAGILAREVHPNLFFTLAAALLASLIGALGIGLLAVRARGVTFLMVTLAFAQMLHALAFQWTELTGGSDGLAGIPRPRLLGAEGPAISGTASIFWLVLAAFLAALWVLRRLVDSPFGRALQGLRENEQRMRSIGYDTTRLLLAAFVVAGGFGGLAGGLFSYYNGFVSPQQFYWTLSGLAAVMVIVGGVGTLVGPVVGAALVLAVQYLVSSYFEFPYLVLGILFAAFVYLARQGILGLARDLAGRLGRRAGAREAGRWVS